MEYLPYVWGLLGLVLMGAEFLIPGFVIFFFGLGAVATGVLTGLVPGLSGRFALQVLVWLGSSALSLVFLRHSFASWFRGRNLLPDEPDDSPGQTVRVLEAIGPDKPGRVRYHGTSWRAESYDESFAEGDEAMILQKKNLTLIVGKPLQDMESD